MSAPKPAVGDSGNLTNWLNKLFFGNSLFELLFVVGLQRLKSAYRAEPQKQERSPGSRSGSGIGGGGKGGNGDDDGRVTDSRF